MKIAVTYENGQIFQHFGHTEYMKLYDVENNEIKSSEIISTNGNGHGALAGFLSSNNVNLLICGGIGGGAVNALQSCNIGLVAGISGDADDAVKNYLLGKLVSTGANCSHHGAGHKCGEHSCH